MAQQDITVDQDRIDIHAIGSIGQKGQRIMMRIPVKAAAVYEGDIGFISE